MSATGQQLDLVRRLCNLVGINVISPFSRKSMWMQVFITVYEWGCNIKGNLISYCGIKPSQIIQLCVVHVAK